MGMLMARHRRAREAATVAPEGEATNPEVTEPFNPADHTPDEVFDYLAGLDDTDPDAYDAEVVRVVEAEEAGAAREEVLELITGTPESDPEPESDPDDDPDE